MCIFNWIEEHQGLAAWIQAIFSVIAILGVIWSNRSQHDSALRLAKHEKKEAALTLAGAVVAIGDAAYKVMQNSQKELNDRELIHQVADGEKYFYKDGLLDQERNLKAIPLHELPSKDLIVHVIMMVSTINQFNTKLDKVFRIHRSMDAYEFQGFFDDINTMVLAAEDISGKLRADVESVRNE